MAKDEHLPHDRKSHSLLNTTPQFTIPARMYKSGNRMDVELCCFVVAKVDVQIQLDHRSDQSQGLSRMQ